MYIIRTGELLEKAAEESRTLLVVSLLRGPFFGGPF